MTDKLAPIHPGEILREEFMMPLDLSSNALARALGVTPARINEIANEKRGITADTALRLARYFGTSPEMWLNLQQRYDLDCASDALGDALEKIEPRTPIAAPSGPPSAAVAAVRAAMERANEAYEQMNRAAEIVAAAAEEATARAPGTPPPKQSHRKVA